VKDLASIIFDNEQEALKRVKGVMDCSREDYIIEYSSGLEEDVLYVVKCDDKHDFSYPGKGGKC